MSIKSDFKDYQTNRKQYLKINLPKKISKTVNIFSLIVLLLTLIPICLYLINAFKIFNVYRLSFILTLIIAICIFLLVNSYLEIVIIRYLRLLYKEDSSEFINLLSTINSENDVEEFINSLNKINLKKYFLFHWTKSISICLIGVLLLYIIFRIFF